MSQTPNTDDWPTTVAKFRNIFGAKATNKRSGLKGRNLMTEEWLGDVDVAGTPVEISTGWFLEQRIFGVTFPPTADGMPDDRSQMAESLEQAYDLLYGSSEDDES